MGEERGVDGYDKIELKGQENVHSYVAQGQNCEFFEFICSCHAHENVFQYRRKLINQGGELISR